MLHTILNLREILAFHPGSAKPRNVSRCENESVINRTDRPTDCGMPTSPGFLGESNECRNKNCQKRGSLAPQQQASTAPTPPAAHPAIDLPALDVPKPASPNLFARRSARSTAPIQREKKAVARHPSPLAPLEAREEVRDVVRVVGAAGRGRRHRPVAAPLVTWRRRAAGCL